MASLRATSKSANLKQRKAIHCDVILDGISHGNAKHREKQEKALNDFLNALGKVVKPMATSPSYNAQDQDAKSPRPSPVRFMSLGGDRELIQRQTRQKEPSINNAEMLGVRFKELLDTEKTYIRRIKVLCDVYLRNVEGLLKVASSGVSIYLFKHLFGNIKEILQANEQFLADLEVALSPNGPLWGQVVAKHLANFARIYKPYMTGIEKARESEAVLCQKVPFQNTMSAIKAKTASLGIGNIGLKELLMEPVQRIPRYKMILEGMLKYMDQEDDNYAFVSEAMAIASQIASCESNENTRRAATMWALRKTVQDFPDTLVSHQRFFVDAIDVIDMPVISGQPLSLSNARGHPADQLPCTLFLFSDCLVICKRKGEVINGKQCSGLDDIENTVQLMTASANVPVNLSPSKMKSRLKPGFLSFKGCVMLDELTGCDLGVDGFALHLEQTPQGASDRWTGRALRHFAMSMTVGVQSLTSEKIRFLDNLWKMQAQQKLEPLLEPRREDDTRYVPPSLQPQIRATEYHFLAADAKVKAGITADAGILLCFTIFKQRSHYNQFPAKKRLSLHFDLSGTSDRVDFEDENNPQAIAKLTPCYDGSFFAATSFRVPACSTSTKTGVPLRVGLMHIVETVHEIGLFNMPPRIPGYQASPSKSAIPVRIRSPSLFGSGSSLSRNGTILSVLSSSTGGSGHRRTGTIRSKMSTAKSEVSSLWSQDKVGTPNTSVYSRESSGSPVLISRDPSHEEVNGDVSRIHDRSSSPVRPTQSLSRSSSGHSMHHTRQMPSYGSFSSILEDEKEVVQAIEKVAMSKSQSYDEMRTIKPRNKLLQLEEVERASSLPPERDAYRSPSPQPAIKGPRPFGSPSFAPPSPGRRPLPQIDNIFLDRTPRPDSVERRVSPSLKRPSEDSSPAVNKKPALQPRAFPSQVKGSARRVSSGRNRKIPPTNSASANSLASSDASASNGNIHDEIENNRNAIKQLKSDMSNMRQKVLMDVDGKGSPGLPRSPVTRNIKSKLSEEIPSNIAVWMNDADNRLAALLAKYQSMEQQVLLQSISKSDPSNKGIDQGVQTEPSPKPVPIPAATPSTPPLGHFRAQIGILNGEKLLIQEQLTELTTTLDAAIETYNEDLDQVYDEAQLSHPEFSNAMRADLKQNKSARLTLMADNDRLKRELQLSQYKATEYEKMLREKGLLF